MELIKGKTLTLQKIVFEVRYNHGYTYLDKCGRTINAIMRERPEWILKNEAISPQAAGLVNIESGCSFNFSSLKYDFSLEMPLGREFAISPAEIQDFTKQATLVSNIVYDHLGISEFSRVGFRAWYICSCSDKAEAENWLRSLSFYSPSDRLGEAFGGTLESLGVTAVVAGQDRSYHIGFNVIERHAQLDLGEELLSVRASSLSKDQREHLQKQDKIKRRMRANPEYAALIDIDAFQIAPDLVDPNDFIQTNLICFSKSLLKANT